MVIVLVVALLAQVIVSDVHLLVVVVVVVDTDRDVSRFLSYLTSDTHIQCFQTDDKSPQFLFHGS